VSLEIVPCTVKDAMSFVAQHHRHHRAPNGGLWAVAVARGDEVVGVAIVAQPVARMLMDGWTAEVIRVAVIEGNPNACSMLYAACRRAALALGWRKLVTYTLPEEGGASLRAAGWRVVAERTGGGSWSRTRRPRVDKHPTQQKIRWEAA
jgi:ribosomal protein L25 (general stress protein Ctc)